MLDSWFREVPAYRIAAFRVVLATTTLCNYLPVITGWLLEAAASPATTASIPWVVHVPLPAVAGLLVLGWVAGFALLAGWGASLSAAYLAALGVYGYAVGNHSHNGFLHLLLLALAACSADGLSLRRLAAGRDTDATCPAWPERLLRLQLAIVYFHTSIDKMFSPEWGLRGLRLTHLESTRVLPGIAHLERGIAGAIAGVAGPLSVATMVGEMGVAVGLTLRRLWPLAVAGNVAFALSLEFLLVPAMFPWDLLALMILFLPAADGAYRVQLSPGCGTCQAQRRVLAALDWTRRLDLSETVADRVPFSIETPTGRRFTGWRAIGLLPWALPAPFLSFLILLRFGSEFVGRGTVGFSLDDIVFVLLGLGALLLLPAADRGAARTAFERLAPVWNLALCGALGVAGPMDACPRHREAAYPRQNG